MLYKPGSRGSLPSDIPKGFLIDLDMAKHISPKPTTPNGTPKGLRRRTGTMLFMAIEILEGTCSRHHWRHDLESFLYVLIWICVTAPPAGDKTNRKILEKLWSGASAASVKLVQVSQRAEWVAMIKLLRIV